MATIANLVVRVQADVAELRTGMEKAQTTVANTAKGIAAAWGSSQILQGLASYVSSVVDAAGQTVDLAAKTGLSIEEIQRMQHVASQTGATLDNFTDASVKLSQKLAGGGDSVKESLAALGLSFNLIRTMSPDAQFRAIAIALGDVTDKNKQAKLSLDLFGKGGAEILPAIAQGYKDLASDATVAMEDQVRALDDLGDVWSKFVEDRKKDATNILGSFVLAAEGAKKAGFVETLHLWMTQGSLAVPILSGVGQAVRETNRAAEEGKNKPPIIDPNEVIRALELKKHLEDVARAREKLFGGDAIEKAKVYAEAIGTTRTVFGEYAGVVKMTRDAQDDANRVFTAAYNALQSIGQGASDAAKQYRDLIMATMDWAKVNAMVAGDAGKVTDAANAMRGKNPLNALTESADDAAFKLKLQQTMRDGMEAGAAEIEAQRERFDAAAKVASDPVVDRFTSAFGQIQQAAATAMANTEASIMGAMELTRAYMNAGFVINEGFGTASTINERNLRSIGKTLPGFANGGIVNAPASGMDVTVHGREAIVPLDKGGSLGNTFNITINASGGGGQQIGKDLLDYLKSKGVRFN